MAFDYSSVIGGTVNAAFTVAGAYATDEQLEASGEIGYYSYLINALMDTRNASIVRESTALAVAESEAEGASTVSSIDAAAGATGLTSQSFSEVRKEAVRNAKMDTLAVMIEGDIAAQDYDFSAAMNELSAQLALATSEVEQDNATLDAATSVIGGFF